MGSHTPIKPFLGPEEDNLPSTPRPPKHALIQDVLSSIKDETEVHDAPISTSLLGRSFNKNGFDPDEAHRAQRRRVIRDSNPFVDNLRSHSKDSLPSPTPVISDVILPPIDETRCDHGLSPTANGDGQSLHLPSLPFDFDPNGLGRSMLPPDGCHKEPDVMIEGSPDDCSLQPPHEAEVPQGTKCEFASPCRMQPSPDGMHYRKVISHIFGRNKATTKLFPCWVWTHYCRKHYQRARYRADQWPFTQCELLLESLGRMESWGGVRSFQLVLRRREQLRLANADTVGQAPGNVDRLATGRKHPTAITSPVPDWLHRCTNREMNFADIRQLVLRARTWMTQLREKEKARQAEASGFGHDGSGEQRPVRQQPSRVRFPDVEILPVFERWVVDEALRQRNNRGHADQDHDARNGHNHGGEDDDEEVADDEDDAPAPAPALATTREIGRTGTNSGRSASQRRRSERNFTNQVSGRNGSHVAKHGAVKKPKKLTKKQ
ncbi:hypothetical protein N7448_010836 [Penicillium atrosanguineum]|uniref:Uncharacterized protein n=1 Tax=Penicillium atrosanguineum TaxID=1132637 RepID=A0A9W9PMN3_9EURO|nr:tRNA (guanine(37)-N1)-methyltransferase [Penicillium atrosanguineum]KAJ5119128.1 hypothetical protein N7526_010765 [Penicillium atrosanguineum]KAJ5120167.1 hypothetical protein N7448_010836 [Penicillium atrosanguineum]KAJ5297165.1 tRNA (guanine(37)-N1)-methyltransferase [Penicillium atrosanguineum]KAJ5299925.1 hypothetical protein N7476_011482 [Penicillium atrosanguineum]